MKRVNSLLEDLLTVEKLESGQLEIHLDAVPLKTLVKDAFTLVEEQAKSKSNELIDDVQDCELVADRGRLSQVLVNFLTNAIKFSPDGGKIRVISARKKGEITVSVQDDGPGIALDEQFHLFEKFYRTPSGKQHKGFGLGLAICKMLIAQHGGTVGVISKAGRGATFWFTLPHDGDDA
jgi:two-component system CheB/CheR fusion protein